MGRHLRVWCTLLRGRVETALPEDALRGPSNKRFSLIIYYNALELFAFQLHLPSPFINVYVLQGVFSHSTFTIQIYSEIIFGLQAGDSLNKSVKGEGILIYACSAAP